MTEARCRKKARVDSIDKSTRTTRTPIVIATNAEAVMRRFKAAFLVVAKALDAISAMETIVAPHDPREKDRKSAATMVASMMAVAAT